MPQGVDTYIEDGFATISVPDKTKRGEVLTKILENTPPALIEKLTRSGPHVQYRIPEGNARQAGLVDGDGGERPTHREDLGFAQALVDADPQVSGRGGQHGEYRTPMAESTVKGLAYHAMPTADGHGVQDGNLNGVEPDEDANGIITAELRPNKNVAHSVPDRPALATPSASELQRKIREKTPRPNDYAPEKTPLIERVPRSQGTIAAVVDRQPQGDAEPAEGIIGVYPDTTVGEANDFERTETAVRGNAPVAAPHRARETGDTPVGHEVTAGTAEPEPAKAPAKKAPAKKAPAKKSAPKKGT